MSVIGSSFSITFLSDLSCSTSTCGIITLLSDFSMIFSARAALSAVEIAVQREHLQRQSVVVLAVAVWGRGVFIADTQAGCKRAGEGVSVKVGREITGAAEGFVNDRDKLS